MEKAKKIIPIAVLLIILCIAGFFRFWHLDQTPPGLYPDVAINGTNALDSIKYNDFKVFYQDNNGREGFFFWLIALSFSIFGPSIWAIKIVAAIIGFFTVLGTYLLTKEILRIKNLKNEAIALLASFFLATSFWHTNFSRIGFRAVMVPFCLVFAFYFIFKGFRTQKISLLVFGGIFLGLGFHTYIAYRFVIFILVAVLVCFWILYKKAGQAKKFLANTFYLLLSAFVVGLPLGLYFLMNRADFFGRAGDVSAFADNNPLFALLKSLALHLGMFNFYGDSNWRHNLSGAPMLPWLLGILFILGIILSIKNLIRAHKDKDFSALASYYLLFSWFVFMLASGFLSAEGAPHALRTIGTIPVVYIFVALGGYWAFKKMQIFFKTKRQAAFFYLLIFLLLFLGVLSDFNKYFYQWGQNPEVAGAFSQNYVDVGNYLNSLPDSVKKYVIVNQGGVAIPLPDGLPVPAQTPMLIERMRYGEVRSTYLLPQDIEEIDFKTNAVIVPLQYDENLFSKLQAIFPEGKKLQADNIWVYKFN